MKRVHEFWHIVIIAIILAFAVSLKELNIMTFLTSLLFFAIIFIVYIGAKKWTAYYLQAAVETKIWMFQRYGFKEKQYFKKLIPIGVILPFLVSVLTLGNFFWLAATQSDITARRSRVIKKHDFYSFSEMTEFHIGVIPAAGIFACIILAFIAYFFNLGELGRLSIFFACFNMIPVGNLDGTKVFFGSLILWFVLAAVSLIALGYAILLI
jgi:hypothetical protein